MAGGLGALFAVHYAIDAHLGAPATQSVFNALKHLDNVGYSLRRAAAPKGLGELLSILGLFTLVVPIAYWLENWLEKRRPLPGSASVFAALGWAEVGLLAVVTMHMHMLLSGDLGRMGYLAAPAFCAALTPLVFTRWRRFVGR